MGALFWSLSWELGRCGRGLLRYQGAPADCPETYPASTDDLRQLCSEDEPIAVFAGDGMTKIILDLEVCVYRASDSALIGIEFQTDVPTFCGGSSFTLTYGTIPDASHWAWTEISCGDEDSDAMSDALVVDR
jgi:hypothetical protein